ncbi:MAG: hypothetical protein OXT09_12175, partial [Myxococcales bacterium]|nr:hypothetical protein [Myxococcales bacterium]
MASKRKQKRAVRPSAAPSAPEVGTGMGELLERAGLSSLSPPDEHPQPASPPPPAEDPEPVTMPPPGPRPPSRLPPSPESEPPGSAPEPFTPRSAGDLAAWNEAYRGVRPLQAARRGADRART